jgi:hypothetical protein
MTTSTPMPEPGEPDPLGPTPDDPIVPQPPVRTPGSPDDPRTVPDQPPPIPSPGPLSQ